MCRRIWQYSQNRRVALIARWLIRDVSRAPTPRRLRTVPAQVGEIRNEIIVGGLVCPLLNI